MKRPAPVRARARRYARASFVIDVAAVVAIIVAFAAPILARPIVVGAHAAIALAYGLIGWLIAPRFAIATSRFGAQVARVKGAGFFFTCALSHVMWGWHAFRTGDGTEGHHVINHLAQAAMGLGFFLFAKPNLGVLIVDVDVYHRVVDERRLANEKELARLGQRSADPGYSSPGLDKEGGE